MCRLRLLMWSLLAVGCVNMVGCGFHEIRPAQYSLNRRARLLVFVDDPDHRLSNPRLSHVVAANVEYHLIETNTHRDIIPQNTFTQWIGANADDFSSMPIDEIGEANGADEVLYVRIVSMSIAMGPDVQRPKVAADIKIIDAHTGERIWPPLPDVLDMGGPSPGQLVLSELAVRTDRDGRQSSTNVVYERLAAQLGLDVSRLFYVWRIQPPGSRFD